MIDLITKDALEKQIPKRMLPDNRYYGVGICPRCGAVFLDDSTNYCGNCGQRIYRDDNVGRQTASRKDLPRLTLLVEEHCERVGELGIDYDDPEIDISVFSEVWGSTALGFSEVVGQDVMTKEYTTVVYDKKYSVASVFYGNRFAYLIEHPNRTFFNCLRVKGMLPVRFAGDLASGRCIKS